MPTEIRVDGMVEESWKLLNELLMTGQMTLSNKKIILPSPELLIRSIADIAKLKPPKVRKMANMDSLRVRKTNQGA